MVYTGLAPVKKQILMKLLSHEGLRYADAAPNGVANDLYNYHLQHLIKQGYVQKAGGHYTLTDAGKQFVESVRPLLPTGDTAELFRVNVLVIVAKEVAGQLHILNQTRKCHPYYGNKGIIGGPLRHGENLEDAYTRVLTDETGLAAVCKTMGIIRKIRFTETGGLFSDIFYHVGLARESQGTLQQTTVYGDNYWVPLAEAIANEQSSVQGGTSIVRVLRQVGEGKKVSFFYYQEHMTVRP
ncbi:MAG TPA: NUDIX domain-containing protein [Candidatus Saccharimonadales bacterium]|nr:NUDIX domain-containing protein [Candidatus Saccharimonadales bacterium]